MQLLHLLLGDLHLLEARLDLREGQEAALLTLGDQRSQLVELRDRSLIRQKYYLLAGHRALRPPSKADPSHPASADGSHSLISLLDGD